MSAETNSIESKKSDIDEIKEAMDDYLRKSSDFIASATQHQDVASPHPSLSVSELQMHPEATTISISPKHKSHNNRFYKFLLIAIMVASLSILLSLIFHFFDLKRQIAHHEAYYKYLHKAVEIKQKTPNETMLSVCHTAIHHMDIVSVYKTRNIALQHLKADIEKLQKQKDNHTITDAPNKKQELILMCDVELQLMFYEIKQYRAEYERVSNVKTLSKLHHEAYFKFLQKAIQFRQQNPTKSILVACDAAIHDTDVISTYKAAVDDIADLKSDVAEVQRKSSKSLNDLNQKEQLVLMCQRELTLRTEAHDHEIQQTQQQRADTKK
eukprot:606045_1